jgi:hypothetical protein
VRNILRSSFVTFAVTLFCAAMAHAVDGVIEINHASIIAAGGYPGAITAPGRYVLTGNLTPPPGSNGINVLAPSVTLDLNGFQIIGAGVATGISGGGANLTVRNGKVTGFGVGITGFACLILQSTITSNGTGIDARQCKIENNVVQANNVGILGTDNLILQNQIVQNSAGGITAGAAGAGIGTVQQNQILENGAFGITDGVPGALVPPPPGPPGRNHIVGNMIQRTLGGPGISLGLPGVIEHNTISASARDGIRCGAACAVTGNSVESNNFTLAVGSGGVTVAPGSNVSDNAISYNFGYGLTLPVTSGYRGNTFFANGGPDVIPAVHPTRAFQNLCSGVVPCP